LGRNRKDASFERLVEALRPCADDNVLDVGCGPGRLAVSLAEYAGHVTGIDLTPEMLAQAKALQAERGVTNVSWHQGDILPLPFADRHFSIAMTTLTFHHLADPAAVLAEMVRVTKPGARIAVMDMIFDPAKAEGFDHIERLRDPSHLRVLTSDALRGLGFKAGLKEVASWSYLSGIPVETVLAASFPAPGDLDRVRAAYSEDARSGGDRLGLRLREENGQVFGDYPMTVIVWAR
jgi:ubiquinone/menaquinone biosynthesis C-methylase UbiE